MIKRERFTNGLQQGNTCFYLHAGPGFGKTYVVKEFLKERTDEYCYICFSEADNDLELLKNHIYGAIRLFYGRITHKNCAQITQNDLQTENAGHFIYNEMDCMSKLFQCMQMLSKLQEKLFMLLDNVSSIQNKKCLKLIEMLAVACTEHGVLFLLSRREEIWLTKQKISGPCIEMTEEEFNFTLEDTKEYLETVLLYPSSLSLQAAKLLMEQFDGWPIGICQSARFIREHIENKHSISWDEILAESSLNVYILKEILDRLSEEEKEFFQEVSVCEDITQELMREVFFINKSRRWLNQLAKTCFFFKRGENGFFIIPAFKKVLIMGQKRKDYLRNLTRLLEFYMDEKHYSRIESLQKQLAEGPFQEEAYMLIMERYHDALLQAKLYDLLENTLLFLMNQNVILPTKILRVAVALFENRKSKGEIAQINSKGDMCSEEREFYQKLLSYNDHTESVKVYFQELFLQEEKEKGTKLKIQMFGNFKVTILSNGKQISWRTKKGCELFALLYSKQGKSMNRQEILEKLWQEEMPKNAVIMLHNMIYNIRKELTPYGLDKIIVYEEHKYKLNVEQIESDFLTVKMLCSMVEDKNIEELLNNQGYFQKYWGSYLSNIDCHWGVICREYYDKTYQNGCMLLASYFIGFGKWLEAVIYLENVLKIDDLQEEACINLIYCYGAIGNRKKAKSVYTKFCHDLKCEINVEPSETLESMYQKCMKKQFNNETTTRKEAK